MRCVGHGACMGEMRNLYKILVITTEGKTQCGRPTCKWKDNIKMFLRESMWDGMDWIHLAQNRDQK
jgi:hypothetical protein